MGKTYDQAPTEVHDRIAALMARYYFDTLKAAGLRIDVLMASTDTEGGHAVTLGGYPCQAVVKILGPKERAMDRGDAEIVIDRDNYEALDPAERDALLDHELYHLELQLDKHGKVKLDDHRRPKLKMKKHDFNVGWFHEIARRHKTASFEVKQAAAFVAEHGQFYFSFAREEAGKLAEKASLASIGGGFMHSPEVESVTISSPGAGSVTFDKSGVSYEPDAKQIASAKSIAESEGYLLLGDQVGLGKTISAIATLTDARTVPAVVVVKAHLPKQWADELARFLPLLRTHIVKQRKPYELPAADVYIVTFSKLDAWWGRLATVAKSVIYDEIQELRIQTSAKYQAAEGLSGVLKYRLGLSATPIYNYGGEIWSVMNLVAPDALGTEDEFKREWCRPQGGHWLVKEPDTFGAYLRNNRLMLRRTRKDVGRELPPVVRHVVDAHFDKEVYERCLTAADELARVILSGSFTERGQAARELDMKLRQATGLAKAPFVAELVKMLVESGERVLLGGWHRAVYDVWLARFKEAGIRVVMFTGSESAAAKEAARKAFIDGLADVMIMSLRSGAGTNGLQFVSSVCVLGEFDWSPAVHEQFIGRLARDGQDTSVQVFLPVAPVGSDPTMATVLGLKDAQATGIVDLGEDVDLDIVETDPQRLKQLAIDYLKSRKLPVPTAENSDESSAETPAAA